MIKDIEKYWVECGPGFEGHMVNDGFLRISNDIAEQLLGFEIKKMKNGFHYKYNQYDNEEGTYNVMDIKFSIFLIDDIEKYYKCLEKYEQQFLSNTEVFKTYNECAEWFESLGDISELTEKMLLKVTEKYFLMKRSLVDDEFVKYQIDRAENILKNSVLLTPKKLTIELNDNNDIEPSSFRCSYWVESKGNLTERLQFMKFKKMGFDDVKKYVSENITPIGYNDYCYNGDIPMWENIYSCFILNDRLKYIGIINDIKKTCDDVVRHIDNMALPDFINKCLLYGGLNYEFGNFIYTEELKNELIKLTKKETIENEHLSIIKKILEKCIVLKLYEL